MKDTDTKNYSSAKIREFAGTDWGRGELNRYHHECIAKQLLNQYADEKDASVKLKTELRWAQDENLAKDEKARIIQSRIDNAEKKVMELRKELAKFASKEIYEMTTAILDALKGRK